MAMLKRENGRTECGVRVANVRGRGELANAESGNVNHGSEPMWQLDCRHIPEVGAGFLVEHGTGLRTGRPPCRGAAV